MDLNIKAPKVIIGLGNPGSQYKLTRHNIGFIVLDRLAEQYNGFWSEKNNMEQAEITINNHKVLLVKPTTFMNNSGQVTPYLQKRGIKPEESIVIHDELELPFGKIAIRLGGKARGHNGLRSLMGSWGENFGRMRFGIGRPEHKEEVGTFVLSKFNEDPKLFDQLVDQAVQDLVNLY